MPDTVSSSRERVDAMEAIGRAFKGAMAAVRRLRGRDTHRPGELSHAQYQLLFELSQRGSLPAGELATLADLSPASVTQMLDRLADAGLVDRVRSEEDRRIVVSQLTAAGQELCEQRRATWEPLWTEMLADFSARDLQTAARVLDRVRELFERMGEREDLL